MDEKNPNNIGKTQGSEYIKYYMYKRTRPFKLYNVHTHFTHPLLPAAHRLLTYHYMHIDVDIYLFTTVPLHSTHSSAVV
jgi:hypothetical protein